MGASFEIGKSDLADFIERDSRRFPDISG